MMQKIDYSINYYDVLGISQEASQDEIKRKYRKLAQHNHPDKNDHVKATDMFLLITEAYAVLSNTTLKKQYDTKFKNKEKQYKSFKLDITFVESLTGVKINTHLGIIDVPQGIRDKAKLVYLDYIIEIAITADNSYTRDGDNVHTNFKVDSIMAVTGGNTVLQYVTGVNIPITVPKGTQHGDAIVIAGHGALNTETKVVGDLRLKCLLVTPLLTDDQIAGILKVVRN